MVGVGKQLHCTNELGAIPFSSPLFFTSGIARTEAEQKRVSEKEQMKK